MKTISDWLDLPPSYGGIGLNSLARSADEELVGSFAGIASSLIEFGRKTELPIYMGIDEALEALGDTVDLMEEDTPPSDERPCLSVAAIADDAARVATSLSIPSDDELRTATHLVRGHTYGGGSPCKWNRLGDVEPELLLLPGPRTIVDFITAPCKQEVSLMRQTRHVKQVSDLLKSMDPIRQTLLRANVGQCGRDSAHCSLQVVRAVATMDCPAALAHTKTSEASLYCTATLNRFGLPVDYAKLENYSLPETCSCCNVPLWDLGMQSTRADRIFIWQTHSGRCGVDGRRHKAHEAVKLAMQRLVLS